MIFRVSSATERVVGRLDVGEDLVEVLSRICEEREVTAGQIKAVGHFDAIELVHFDTRTQSYETLVDGEGSFDLVSLDGTVSRLGGEVALRLAAVFNVIGPLGPQMVGGQLRRARAKDAEFVLESFADLQMERRLDPESGRLVLEGIERKSGVVAAPKAAPQAAPSQVQPDRDEDEQEEPSMSWDEAIAEAEEVEKRREKKKSTSPPRQRRIGKAKKKKKADPYADLDLDEPLMSKGDLLDHPKLGRCRVLDVDEGESVRIRLPRGRIRKLTLAVLEIEYKGKEDGSNIFEARVRR